MRGATSRRRCLGVLAGKGDTAGRGSSVGREPFLCRHCISGCHLMRGPAGTPRKTSPPCALQVFPGFQAALLDALAVTVQGQERFAQVPQPQQEAAAGRPLRCLLPILSSARGSPLLLALACSLCSSSISRQLQRCCPPPVPAQACSPLCCRLAPAGCSGNWARATQTACCRCGCAVARADERRPALPGGRETRGPASGLACRKCGKPLLSLPCSSRAPRKVSGLVPLPLMGLVPPPFSTRRSLWRPICLASTVRGCAMRWRSSRRPCASPSWTGTRSCCRRLPGGASRQQRGRRRLARTRLGGSQQGNLGPAGRRARRPSGSAVSPPEPSTASMLLT